MGESRAGVPIPAELVRARRAKRTVSAILPHGRDSCVRKVRHDTAEAAEREAERMECKQPESEFNHYRCRFCGDWHVGRPVKGTT